MSNKIRNSLREACDKLVNIINYENKELVDEVVIAKIIENFFVGRDLNEQKDAIYCLINQNIYWNFESSFKEAIQKKILSSKEIIIYTSYYHLLSFNMLTSVSHLEELEWAQQIGEEALNILDMVDCDEIANMNNNKEIPKEAIESLKKSGESTKAKILYNLGNLYIRCNEIEKAIEKYEGGKELNHMPSVYNLANIYYLEDFGYYNENMANTLYLEAAQMCKEQAKGKTIYSTQDKRIHVKPEDVLYFATQPFLYNQAGRIMLERKEYDEALEYLDKAKDACMLCTETRIFRKTRMDELQKLIDAHIMSIEGSKKEVKKYTEKHQEVCDMFSEKAKEHLEYEHYIAVETSLLVYDFLESNPNTNLDYSSAIISILKCVEDLLFPIFGVDYFNFVKKQENINYNDLPKNFLNYNKDRLVEKVDNMEYGSIIYACCYYRGDSRPIKEIFLKFLRERGIKNEEKIATEFIENLIYIKNNYRNYTAHRGRIKNCQAKECLEYLLITIKFINKFLEDLYV